MFGGGAADLAVSTGTAGEGASAVVEPFTTSWRGRGRGRVGGLRAIVGGPGVSGLGVVVDSSHGDKGDGGDENWW